MVDSSALPQIEGLLELARRDGVDVRPTLLRVLTDLYVQARWHSQTEETQYVELSTRLIDSVDQATRDVVAARLAGYPRAPRAVLDKLSAAAGASSTHMSIPVSDPAPDPAPLPADDLSAAFFAADSFERRLILTNLDAVTSSAPNRAAMAAVETCRRLEAAMLDRNIGEFVRLIASALMLPRPIAERILADNSGEPILVVARALGMPTPALQRILLLINPAIGHSVERVYELAALYDEISFRAAEKMIDIWRGRARRPAAYQPLLYAKNDEQQSARAVRTPSRYRSETRTEPQMRARSSGR